MKNYVAIYVPSTVDVNRKTENTSYLQDTMEVLSSLFGGCTVYETQGGWMSEQKGLVIEKVSIVKAFYDIASKSKMQKVIKQAKKLKKEMKQEAVSLEVNGELSFV